MTEYFVYNLSVEPLRLGLYSSTAWYHILMAEKFNQRKCNQFLSRTMSGIKEMRVYLSYTFTGRHPVLHSQYLLKLDEWNGSAKFCLGGTQKVVSYLIVLPFSTISQRFCLRPLTIESSDLGNIVNI